MFAQKMEHNHLLYFIPSWKKHNSAIPLPHIMLTCMLIPIFIICSLLKDMSRKWSLRGYNERKQSDRGLADNIWSQITDQSQSGLSPADYFKTYCKTKNTSQAFNLAHGQHFPICPKLYYSKSDSQNIRDRR